MPVRRVEPFVAPTDRSPDRTDLIENDDSLQTADLQEEATADLAEIAALTARTSSVRWAEQSRKARAEPRAAAGGPGPGRPEPQTGAMRDSPRLDGRPTSASRTIAPRANSKPTSAATSTATATPRADPTEGSILCDRYLLERIIGTGRTSVVWRARDLHWQSSATSSPVVAVKILRANAAHVARSTARLRHEFQCAKNLSHPNIPRVIDLHCVSDSCFMIRELVEGKPLPVLLHERANLRESVVRRILQGCAAALMHAHSCNVVHGDFRPGNIFVTADGSAKVMNFGSIDFAAAKSRSVPDGARGNERSETDATSAYASPEVLEGQLPERRDDVFSFACVAFELLALQHPFEHGRSTQARDVGWIPPRAWSLSAPQWLALLSALAWQREQRTADVGTLLTALLAKPPEPADPPPELLRAPGVRLATKPLSSDLMRPDRSWKYFLIGLIALLVVLIVLR